MADFLAQGTKAPNFIAQSTSGEMVSLKDFAGKQIVLYFYPKDDTPGCTKEACGFRDTIGDIQAKGAVVLGVSRDTMAKHLKFKEKFHLNFDLLSDEDGKITEAYRVWGEKSMYGRKYFGIFRVTYIIDEQGNIKKVFPKVNPTVHAKEVLEALN
ncbi:MAG: thioredoxin-dependent thiol peroxidase [Candidatus Abawacabacteria bacterium]|nr:thioredoxin-dependent thiol peroxidase [Candidatus Abawacabacteria bacterium]